jgi:ribonuclease VapC
VGKSLMFLDASAIIAIIAREPEAKLLAFRLESASSPPLVSPLAIFEAVAGLARKKAKALGGKDARTSPELLRQARRLVEIFLTEAGASEITIDGDIGRGAQDACMTYGAAVGSPADLNFGDCFSYACAKTHQVPLLYKGEDFKQTDLG